MREYDLSRLRALIVDDSHHFTTIVRTMLRAFELRAIFASPDAVNALELLKQTEIDLAIIDLKLGEMDGLELTRLIRSAPDSQNPRIPIIMVTAFTERSNVEAAISAGVDEFLIKPLSPAVLYDRIVWLVDNPRPYLRSGTYFGPDRRRRCARAYRGTDRRSEQVGHAP